MKSTISIIGMLILIALAFWMIGCSGDHDGMMSGSISTNSLVAKVYPAEGATNVSTSVSIAITFSAAMDTISVINNFHLAFGDEMHEWMDSANHYGGLEHMSMDNMSRMMQLMDAIIIPGKFHWNDTLDSCEFIPDIDLIANHEHMILMYEGSMMNNGSGMVAMNHGVDEYYSFHFVTGP